MENVESTIEPMFKWSSVPIAVLIFTLLPAASLAKTPDGVPPSQETVCSGLQGAAFGLCNAYCEAQDCDVHPRPSCAHLLANFRRITGMPSFPCDVVCGDGAVDPGEDCDPPGSLCADEVRTCTPDCTCPEPSCGDGILDPGEQCDPGSPLSICPCLDDCTCETTGPTCCDCGGDIGCVDVAGTGGCPTACAPVPGTVCSQMIRACVPPEPVCCACEGPSCFEGVVPEDCVMLNCAPSSPGFSCSENGFCVGIGPAP
jgi:hypothetical protein